MAANSVEGTITVDNVEYKIDELSDKAKEHIVNIQFVDAQIQQLNNEWAVADTAKIGYTNALKSELMKTKESDQAESKERTLIKINNSLSHFWEHLNG